MRNDTFVGIKIRIEDKRPQRLSIIARRHGLHYVQLPVNDVPSLETHLYWHESTDQDPANRWMREQIIEIAQQVGSQTP